MLCLEVYYSVEKYSTITIDASISAVRIGNNIFPNRIMKLKLLQEIHISYSTVNGKTMTQLDGGLVVGCPRNKQKNFWLEPKQTETRSVSVVFRFVS